MFNLSLHHNEIKCRVCDPIEQKRRYAFVFVRFQDSTAENLRAICDVTNQRNRLKMVLKTEKPLKSPLKSFLEGKM